MARPTRRPGNLPAEATSFIGRRRELAELRKKLTGARLVSLVGPGGVGKSRLAIRIATDLGRGFPGGAWLVQLAEVQDAALVGNAVMAALDLRDQAATEPLAPGWAYFVRGFLAVLQSDPPAARPALLRAAAAAREAGQFQLLSQSLSMASIAENMFGDRVSRRRPR